MSSRALRRLHREADVIRLGGNESGSEDGEEENPVFQPQNKKKGRSKGFVQAVQDPFELVINYCCVVIKNYCLLETASRR